MSGEGGWVFLRTFFNVPFFFFVGTTLLDSDSQILLEMEPVGEFCVWGWREGGFFLRTFFNVLFFFFCRNDSLGLGLPDPLGNGTSR